MYGNIRVTFSSDELIILKAAVAGEIRHLEQLVGCIGDPHGFMAEDKMKAEALHKKLGAALKRI